jgi:hypothetical protein
LPVTGFFTADADVVVVLSADIFLVTGRRFATTAAGLVVTAGLATLASLGPPSLKMLTTPDK